VPNVRVAAAAASKPAGCIPALVGLRNGGAWVRSGGVRGAGNLRVDGTRGWAAHWRIAQEAVLQDRFRLLCLEAQVAKR
jgi:hypothetical protein